MTPEADRLLHWMPIIVRASGISDWERKFCASMIARSRRQAFTPSEKQIEVMDRIVTAFQSRELAEAEGADVIPASPPDRSHPMTAQPLPCLFDLTPDRAKLRDIARRQVQARMSMRSPSPRPDVERGLALAMLETAKQSDATSLSETRQNDAATAVLDQLAEPRTAKWIAETLRKSETGVMNTLRRLHDQRRVEVADIGQNGARLWVRTDAAYQTSAAAAARAQMGEKTRAAIISALVKPLCARRVAIKTGISRFYAAEILLNLYRAGKITRTKAAGSRAAIYARVKA